MEGEEDWAQYVERIGHFFGANGVSDMSKKLSVLRSSIGSKAYQTLASLVAPETPRAKSYEELYRFHSRVRQQGESVTV